MTQSNAPPSRYYRTVAVIDANVILEGRPVDKLPWAEIDSDGPILVLVLPQVQREIDSKKRDGRLQVHARSFNRLIAPVAVSGTPLLVVDGAPKVDLGLARCAPIPWSKYDDLDPAEGDCKVIAELLNILDFHEVQMTFISADIYPISLASRRGIRAFHAKESWMRQAEPSPADKEIQRLKGRISELESKEPKMEVGFEIAYQNSEPVRLYRIEGLDDSERKKLAAGVIGRNPKKRQYGDRIGMDWQLMRDPTYDGRYEEYVRKAVPRFAGNIEKILESLYAQIPFRLTVSNVGKVQAEGLIVEVEISSGWFQEKLFYRSAKGPSAPEPRSLLEPSVRMPDIDLFRDVHRAAGIHDVSFNPRPNKNRKFAVHCLDFRHGRSWTFEGVFRLDPWDSSDAYISVRTTTSNMRGEILNTIPINRAISTVNVVDLLDFRTGDRNVRFPMENVLEEAMRSRNFDRIKLPKDDE